MVLRKECRAAADFIADSVAINFAAIHKLVFEISCLQKLIAHRHTDIQTEPSTESAADGFKYIRIFYFHH